MKKYIKNKRFIPYNIYKKSEAINNKIESRILIIFILIGCFLFSMNIKQNNLIDTKKDILLKTRYEKENTKISNYEIINYCEDILSDDILESEMTSEGGSVKVKSFDDVNKFLKNEKYEITNIESDDKNNYKVSFYLNE